MTWHRITADCDALGRRVWRCLNCGQTWTTLPPLADRTGCAGVAL